MSTAKKVVLKSSDDQKFVVERKVADKSLLIKRLIDDLIDDDDDDDDDDNDENSDGNDVVIPVPNVRSTILKKVLEWAEHHKDTVFPDVDDEDVRNSMPVDEWDQKFLEVDQEMLYEIILAANYLNIRPLLNAGCKVVAEMIRGKSPEEIRKVFSIENDFTPEEEAAIKRENEWAEDR